MRIIETEADIAEGMAHLIKVEPRFSVVLDEAGPPPLRRREGGFRALVWIISGQQVSVAAGQAIFERVEAAGCCTPEACLARDEEQLRALGLSRPKARAVRAAAEAMRDGALCFDRLRQRDVEAAMAEMTAIKGVGPWTAEIYQMFAVGRADVFPPKDLALQEAARALLGLQERPSDKKLAQIAEPWSPWRGVAARALWSYYRVIKGRSGQALEAPGQGDEIEAAQAAPKAAKKRAAPKAAGKKAPKNKARAKTAKTPQNAPKPRKNAAKNDVKRGTRR